MFVEALNDFQWCAALHAEKWMCFGYFNLFKVAEVPLTCVVHVIDPDAFRLSTSLGDDAFADISPEAGLLNHAAVFSGVRKVIDGIAVGGQVDIHESGRIASGAAFEVGQHWTFAQYLAPAIGAEGRRTSKQSFIDVKAVVNDCIVHKSNEEGIEEHRSA